MPRLVLYKCKGCSIGNRRRNFVFPDFIILVTVSLLVFLSVHNIITAVSSNFSLCMGYQSSCNSGTWFDPFILLPWFPWLVLQGLINPKLEKISSFATPQLPQPRLTEPSTLSVVPEEYQLEIRDHPPLSLTFNLSSSLKEITEREGIITCLKTKGKMGFITGTLTQPAEGSLKYRAWIKNDVMLTPWIRISFIQHQGEFHVCGWIV